MLYIRSTRIATLLALPLCTALFLTGCNKAEQAPKNPANATSSATSVTASGTTATANTGAINYVQESAEQATKARVKMMKAWGGSLKTLGGMLKNPSTFNADTVKAETAKLNTDPWVHFAPGTKADRAMSVIWDKPDQFQAEVNKYKTAVTSLNAAAQTATSVDSIKAPFGEVGASCKSCHTAFRAEE